MACCYIYKHPDCRENNIYKIGSTNRIERFLLERAKLYINDISEYWLLYLDSKLNSIDKLAFVEKAINEYITDNLNHKDNEKGSSRGFHKISDINKIINELPKYLSDLGVHINITTNVKNVPN